MIDWLRRSEQSLSVDLAGREVPVAIRRHPTARRMTLRLAPDGTEVRITLPPWGRTEEALEFARSRRDWLTAQLDRCTSGAARPAAGGTLLFRGQEFPISWHPEAPRRASLTGGELRIGGPQDNLAQRLQRWLESEALKLMGEDLLAYCLAAGAQAPSLRLSRAQRRWGSCAGDGTIRINWRLVQAPDFVRKSVVAHEVAHLIHFDHSPQFHALLGEIFEGDVRAANRWLKEHGRGLYSAFG